MQAEVYELAVTSRQLPIQVELTETMLVVLNKSI